MSIILLTAVRDTMFKPVIFGPQEDYSSNFYNELFFIRVLDPQFFHA